MQSVRKGASWKEAPLTPDPHALSISTRGLPVPRVNSPEASRGNKGARTKGLPDFLRVPLPGAVLALSPGLLPQTSLCRGPGGAPQGSAGSRAGSRAPPGACPILPAPPHPLRPNLFSACLHPFSRAFSVLPSSLASGNPTMDPHLFKGRFPPLRPQRVPA